MVFDLRLHGFEMKEYRNKLKSDVFKIALDILFYTELFYSFIDGIKISNNRYPRTEDHPVMKLQRKNFHLSVYEIALTLRRPK